MLISAPTKDNPPESPQNPPDDKPPTIGPDNARVLVNLNTLRAIAALAVVYYHITADAGLNFRTTTGAYGVDIFFVISGFIIAYTSERHANQFFIRRLIRIVPFYWAATLGLFALVSLAPNLLRSTRPDVVQLICSLFFLPRETTYAGLFPTMVLGWSLNYEMYFYIVFSLSLLLWKRLAPIICSMVILAVIALIDGSGIQAASVTFYARPLVIEFIFGIVIFYLFSWAEEHAEALRSFLPGKALSLLILAVSLVLIFYIESVQDFGIPRQISAGIPAFFIVLSSIVAERIYRSTFSCRALFLLGEASYILYLIHPYIVFGTLRTVLRNRGPFGPFATAAIVFVLMVASSVIAIVIHLWFEKPVMHFLRRKLLDKKPPAAFSHINAHPTL